MRFTNKNHRSYYNAGIFIVLIATILMIILVIGTTACEPQERIIKIGNQGVFSGEYKAFGDDQLVSVELAASKLSPVKIGGFDYKIEVVTKDDEGNPEKAFLIAQEMTDEEVAGVIGSTFDGTTSVSIPVYAEYNIPIISPFAQKAEISKISNNFFRTIINNNQKVKNISDFIIEDLKPQNLVVIDNREEYSVNLVDFLNEDLENKNYEVSKRYSFKINDEDIAILGENLLIDKPDYIFFCAKYDEVALLISKVRELGLESKFITENLGMDDGIFMFADAANLEGLLAVIPEPPSISKYSEDRNAINFWHEYNEFLSKMDEADLSVENPGPYAPYCYDSVFLLIEAMEKSNSILPGDYLDELRNTSFDGVIGHIEFDSNGDRVNPESTIFIIKNGAWVRQS